MNSFLMVGLFVVGSAFTSPESCIDSKGINISESTVTWTANKVTGSHNGTMDIKVGSIDWKDNKLMGGSFEVDMQSITVSDLTGEYKSKLEGHLKSEDFFSVNEFPTASFNINSVMPADGENMYAVSGSLTIKGITHPISFNATISDKSATAKIKVDRTKYNVKYGSSSFFDNLGDKAIYDEFDIDVALVLE